MKQNFSAVRSVIGLAWRCSLAWWPQVFALAVSSGIIVATISGALGVGDAMERGLLKVALSRLGEIDTAVLSNRPFRKQLARELADCIEAETVVPALVMEVSVEVPATAQRGRVTSRATLLACDQLSSLGFKHSPQLALNEVSVNASLSEVLGIKAGEPVILRVVDRPAIPGDSPLGRRTLETRSRRLDVKTILPKESLGDFSIQPTQVTGGLVVASLSDMQSILRKNITANVLFCIAKTRQQDSRNDSLLQQVKGCLRPTLSDYGLSLTVSSNRADESTTLRLVSKQLLLDRDIDQVAQQLFEPLGGHRSFVFLANSLRPQNSKSMIPYSTVVGLDTVDHPLGRLVGEDAEPLELPGYGEIIIDQWMADDLAAQGTPVSIGDTIEVATFLPETLHGRVEEQVTALRISGIAAMKGVAIAREMVPEVEGITDEKSIADWDPPFPFNEGIVRVTPPNDQDDRYWQEYGASPKAFVSLGTARDIAGSRFGETTAWHVPFGETVDRDKLEKVFAELLAEQTPGFRVVPLSRRAVTAARGSTPFGGLFIGLSSVVVIAGLILEWLLFRLIVIAHHRDAGVLLALGWPDFRLSRLLLCVGGIAILGGVLLGAVVAPIWSITLLEWLGHSWNEAVAAGSQQIFVAAYPRLSSMWPGMVCAAGISLAAVWWAAHRASRSTPLRLLRDSDTHYMQSTTCRYGVIRSIGQLAYRSIFFKRSRSFAVIFIVALAEFLVVVVSAFSLKLSDQPDGLHSPTGGWTHIASFGEPNGIDIENPDTVASLGLSEDEQAVLKACVTERIRSNGGDDASCTNLYAATRPRVLGVSPSFIERGGFRFVSHASLSPDMTSPWSLLNEELEQEECIPVILDQATAQWGLKLGGVGSVFPYLNEHGDPAHMMKIVGLLETGLLQGAMITSEENFVRIFPDRSGYSMALVDASALSAQDQGVVSPAIATAWADAGVSVEMAIDRLRSLYAVQNTFLSGFQILGSLGLLLGTFGVAAVQLQGVLERRGAMALLRSIGFTVGRLRGLIVRETVLLVGSGLGLGGISALLVLSPLLYNGQANVPWAWLVLTAFLTLFAAALTGFFAACERVIPIRPPSE